MESDSKPKLAPSSSKESDKFENSELKSVIDSAEPLDCFKPASSGQALVQGPCALCCDTDIEGCMCDRL